jgi:hypothetical protein
VKKDLIHILLVCLAAFIVIVSIVEVRRNHVVAQPNCVEQPSVSLPLKNMTVHGNRHFGHTVCGIRSRSALPDVIQCYEMQDGCTE